MSSSRRTTLFRVAIGLYVACIFLLVGGYVAVSGMEVGGAMYLQASHTLQAGAPNAARGLVMDARTGRLYRKAPTTFRIGDEVVGEASTASHGHLHAQLRPTAAQGGAQQLVVSVDHPAMEELAVAADVEVVTEPLAFAWPEETSTRLTDEKKSTPPPWDGALEVVTIPRDGEIPRGLPAKAYLLLRDAETGAPVQGVIEVSKVEGILERPLPGRLETDALGLVRISMTATTSVRLTLTARDGDRSGTGTVRFSSVVSQFALEPSQLAVLPGQAVQAGIATLHRSGGILVDLYDGERWAAADAFGIGPQGAGVRVVAPDELAGPLVRLQVYQDMFETGAAWDSRWLVVASSAAPDACKISLRTVLQLHEAHEPELGSWARHALALPALNETFSATRCEQWLDAALLAVPHHFVPAPLLLNTQQADRAELEGWQREVRAELIVATTGVLLVGFGIVLLLVLQGLRRRQVHAAELHALEVESASDAELAAAAPRLDLDRVVLIVQTVIIVLTLLSFGASLLTLLTWM